jgi:hypothetical protein
MEYSNRFFRDRDKNLREFFPGLGIGGVFAGFVR